jgi:hypothetical protein
LDKSNNFLSIADTNTIVIKTQSVQVKKSYYLVQRTKGGKSAYIQFQIEIIPKEQAVNVTKNEPFPQNESQSI